MLTSLQQSMLVLIDQVGNVDQFLCGLDQVGNVNQFFHIHDLVGNIDQFPLSIKALVLIMFIMMLIN